MDKILENEMQNHPDEDKIFTNEQFLSLDFIPNNVLFREEKIKQLFTYFKSFFNSFEENYAFMPTILVLGQPGTGKSLTIRRFGLEFQYLIEKKKPSLIFEFRYLNCRRNRTIFSFLVSLMKSFLPDFPSRGFSSSEILRMFQDMLIQTHTHVLLALDEINYLINDPDFQNFLYSLTRLNEDYLNGNEQRISMVLIAQDDLFLNYLDNAVKSSLYKNIVFFEKYSREELKGILIDRCEISLVPNVATDELIDKIASLTEYSGDARFAIELLWRSAKRTQQLNLSNISEEILLQSLHEIMPFNREIIKDLSFQQKIFLLSIIQCFERNPDAGFVTLSQIKSEFLIESQELHIQLGTGNTSLWNHLQVLKKLEIIEIDIVSKNYRGRFSKIFLKAPKNVLKRELSQFLNHN